MYNKNWALILIFPILGLCFFSCSNLDQNYQTELPYINLAEIAEGKDTLFLSDYAKEISYIKLETKPDCVIGQPKYIIRKDKIFVLDLSNEKMYLFNTKGEFIRQIGSKGKGPQEYIGGRDMHVSTYGDTVHLLSTPMRTIYRYSVSGKKLGSTKIHNSSWKLAPLQNGNYIILTPFGYPHPDSAQSLFYTQDKNGQVLFIDHTTPNIPRSGKFDLGNFYITPLNTLVQHPFSDSVYSLSKDGKMEACMVLDFGKYKTPNELFNNKNEHRKAFFDYANWLNLVETEKAIYISFYYQRIKRTGIYFLNNKKESRLGIGNGSLVNNIDGGPDFWPTRSDGDKMAYTLIQPFKLIEDYENADFDNKSFIDIKAREKLISLIKNLKESDNPIIMMVRLK